jgi:hypothetical protein
VQWGQSDQVVSGIEEVYRVHYPQLLRVATAKVGDESSAHDAVQDGFAQALKQGGVDVAPRFNRAIRRTRRMERTGIEPVTSALQRRRSPS